jgi:hypothetical protein
MLRPVARAWFCMPRGSANSGMWCSGVGRACGDGNSMRLITWRQLGLITSVVWVAVGPTYFHLSQEDDARRRAGDRYQLCIKQDWARKGGVEGCNREFRQALTIAHWSSWAKLAFIPVTLAWFVGWALFVLVRRVRSSPQAGSGLYPQTVTAEDNGNKGGDFPPPWTVEPIEGGFKVIDSNGQTLAYVYGHADKRDAETAKSLTLDEARRIASNIAKLKG